MNRNLLRRGLATVAALAGAVALTGVVPTPAAAAANPNPGRITDASWWLMEQLLDLESGSRNGGIYVDKPGYHNTRAGNASDNYSVRHAEDQGGPSDKAAAYDWTFPDAQSRAADVSGLAASDYAGPVNPADFTAAAADYSTIAKYSKRLLASGQDDGDPRLDGWKEFFGQTDNDQEVEGWDFRADRSTTSDDSHLWHIHLSEDRNKVESYDNKRALLSVLRGETVAQWKGAQGSVSGDDRADLLVHGVDGVISHRVNQGTWFDGGTVRSQGWSNFMGYNGSGKLYFADIDGDRKTDLLVHGTDGVISVRYNKGTYWDAGTTISQGWSNFLGYPGKGRLYFADFNGDSRADMIVHGVGGDISVRINQGTWFDGGTNISNGWSNFMGYNNSGKLYFTDINGDRKTDLLVHSTDGVISVRYNQGTYWDAGRTLTQGWGNFLGYPDKGKLYFADINADGRSDLLVHGTDGAIHVRYNQGTWFDGGTLITQGWGNFMGYNNSGQLYFA
jgi:hypothetical protein